MTVGITEQYVPRNMHMICSALFHKLLVIIIIQGALLDEPIPSEVTLKYMCKKSIFTWPKETQQNMEPMHWSWEITVYNKTSFKRFGTITWHNPMIAVFQLQYAVILLVVNLHRLWTTKT